MRLVTCELDYYSPTRESASLFSFISQDVNTALANLHSYAKNSDEMTCVETRTEEENRVLLDDDLVDDDEW